MIPTAREAVEQKSLMPMHSRVISSAMQDMLLYIWGMDRLYMPARKEPALHMVMRPIVPFYQSDAYRRVENGIRKTRESESLLHNRGK